MHTARRSFALRAIRPFATLGGKRYIRTRMKILLAVAAAMGIAVAQTVFAAAAEAPTGEDARIEQAVNAYAAKLKSDQEHARDQLVARHETALLNDPHTPVIGDPDAD